MGPPTDRNRRARGPRPVAAVAIVLGGAVLVAAIALLATGLLEADEASPHGAPESGPKQIDAGPDRDARVPGRTPIAVVKRRTALRAQPGGRRIETIGRRTEFKSPRVLAVVAKRGDWLRVMAAELPNGRTAWVNARDTQAGAVDYGLRVDLSARRLEVVRRGEVVRRVRTAVGEQGTPTPTGTFAVTDKVAFTKRGSPYGCCALALTAHQPDTPPEWTGGDRIAIHATPARDSIGRSITLGCMRVPTRDARWLMRRIPLGSQVSVRA